MQMVDMTVSKTVLYEFKSHNRYHLSPHTITVSRVDCRSTGTGSIPVEVANKFDNSLQKLSFMVTWYNGYYGGPSLRR